jgi:hypothetical protein
MPPFMKLSAEIKVSPIYFLEFDEGCQLSHSECPIYIL